MNPIGKVLRRMLAVMDDWLFPQDVLCLCCDRALGEDGIDGLCPACAQALEKLNIRQEVQEAECGAQEYPAGVEYVRAAYPYEGEARRLIHLLKFESVRAAALPLAKSMAYLPSGEEEILVPVPTDQRRKRKRGYNQATLLAKHISRELGMPVSEALTRVRRRGPQTGLSLEERRKNLVGCMVSDNTVEGKRVLLVDDVYTSGSTAAEAARALYAAGCKSVGVFVAARAGTHDEGYLEPFPIKNGSIRFKKAGGIYQKL